MLQQIACADNFQFGIKEDTKYPQIIQHCAQEGTVVDGWVYTDNTWISPRADFWMSAFLATNQAIDDRLANNKIISLIHYKRVNTDFATITKEGDNSFVYYPAYLNKKSSLVVAEAFDKDYFVRTG